MQSDFKICGDLVGGASPVSRPGRLTNGVLISRSGTAQGLGGVVPVIVRPSVERYACNFPAPPPSAAGSAHAAVMVAPPTLPKRALAGGGTAEQNAEYAITHPVCEAE